MKLNTAHTTYDDDNNLMGTYSSPTNISAARTIMVRDKNFIQEKHSSPPSTVNIGTASKDMGNKQSLFNSLLQASQYEARNKIAEQENVILKIGGEPSRSYTRQQ